LEPLKVFQAVASAVKGMSGSLDAFTEELEKHNSVKEDEVGGGSTQELISYGTAGPRTAQVPQSSALLLDLLRW
jgi:hypothetical protein